MNNSFDVLIEISKNGRVKYEYDFDNHKLRCDRVLSTPFSLPFNYGFIPNTLSGDGDPIDAIVYMEEPIISGTLISCRVIGGLETIDDKGTDTKLILCPIDSVSPNEKNIKTLNDLPYLFMDKIKYFYKHYKDLENKKVTIGKLLTIEESLNKIQEAITNFSTR